ncbi:hypothetical protein EZV62_013272 [Acer yangbiense]|uniref:Leucine-rich repeat-containing N-terminal plant-type domain-containing protein n=1 Tax=Acer yangbiense TaxID=1000413 RepID=A0A5C7HZ06_9ROSI|nr:hypothetical protein EZV62_013272 [Acer yangbiense]
MASFIHSWMLVWLAVLIFIVSLESRWSEGCLEQERFALLQLKPFFNTFHELDSWVEGDHNNSDCCQWDRVECNNDTTSRVILLDLSYSRISGEWYLNASLFSPFQQLHTLDLSYSGIAGCVENEGFDKLSTLSNLEALYISENSFNNSILSSLSTLSSLKNLSLSYNKLKGIVDLQEARDHILFINLSSFFLENVENDISSLIFKIIEIVYEITYSHVTGWRLSNLEYLGLSGNIFNNNILSSISALSSLKTLYLRDVGLEGSVDLPDNGIVGLKNLQFLSLRNVSIHDGSTLLQSLGSLPYLKRLDLRFNNFSGNIMSTRDFSNLKNLKHLIMDGTNLNISVLQNIGLLTSLEFLSLQSCNLEDTLPDQGYISGGLCELKHLQHLDLSYNDIRGSLPWCFGNLTSIQELYLSSNQFSGNISPLRALTSIQQLHLYSNQFSGNISPLTALTSIQRLSLWDNHFQIPISLEPFFNHSKLKTFYGENNQIYADTAESHFSITPKFQLNELTLSGCRDCVTFPKFLYHQHDLEQVDLSHNNLTGEFPNWLLDNNTNLYQLVLVNNSLTGPLHLPTHSHQNLWLLDISKNFFRGNIPIQVGAYLPMLSTLNISINDFDGRIPSSIGDMNSLQSLDLSYNKLSGGIPEHLAKSCINLRYLVLSNNSLEGQIFSAANFNLTNLVRLQLDGNRFIGKIPECLSNSSSYLTVLHLGDNLLSGRIPSWLGNMSELVDLKMPNNHLEGPIPPEFCQLQNLEVLNLSENNIFGDLPSRFSPPQIQQVHLSKNKLEGQLKDAFFNSSSLVTLDLGYNRFNGRIPNWIGRLSNLTYLILSHNNLEGEVPHLLCNLERLRLIDLSHNNFSGQIPHCLDMTALHGDFSTAIEPMRNEEIVGFELKNASSVAPMRKEETVEFTTKKASYSYQGRILTYMSGVDLSCNKLTGEIPHQIGNLTRIHTLNLSYNHLTGSIPMTFSNLQQIESLDLSHNNLNGKIPLQIIELYNLAVFSVAYNNLSGKTPEMINQFGTFEESSYQGNPLLCGLPLPKSCGPPPLAPKAVTDIEEDNSFMDRNIFYSSFTASYIVVVLAIAIVLNISKYSCSSDVDHGSGQIGQIGLVCCATIAQVSEDCWPKMFPINPLFTPLLKTACAAPSTNSPVANAAMSKVSFPGTANVTEIIECWSTLKDIDGCVSEIYKSILNIGIIV